MEASCDATTITNLKPLPAEEPQLDLYTIPISSGWFSWDAIHETERKSLKEFFDGSSISRTPKIYREYRDFIINKYREEPSRRLTFTEIRKSLIGDVSLLLKVFNFLDKWGLINCSASLKDAELGSVEFGGEEKFKVKVEEGAPNGIRVVATPNSLKPISVPLSFEGNGEALEGGVKYPLLGSYADVFGDSVRVKRLVCGNCGEDCVAGHHECTKEGASIICVKCYSEGKYGENKFIDDFKYVQNSGNSEAVWTEEETLNLLESVMKHGDDWELVAQSIPSKNIFDCISKLIQLPFGELILGSTNTRDTSIGVDESLSSIKQVPLAALESQDPIQSDNMSNEQKKNVDLDEETQGPPLKKQCIPGSSLMKQVALICSMVSPDITAAASDAAISAICIENQLAKEIFNTAEDVFTNEVGLPCPESESERGDQIEDLEMKERPILSETQDIRPEKNAVPLTLRMKAAIATALGAAAARSKLLADQEEREMEHMVAAIIDTQLKKLQYKVKLLEDLEEIMEKEYALIEELEESIISERIDVLQRLLSSGVSRRRDHTSVKS